ncbi:hydroxymethylglutaryl-CoA lyase [Extensimonas vulgaris]|uniref:Hydroxymethylglutaryl-CoA lyase n=1 Tax=Extensimonas vulgaris TaxID=1031594 RepID=A0A369AJ35_9BURK|nr:hydroxymethylglutaryl-CoA lyase [Extensimonas vulgaris]RCX09409.1 hydroxymethylglutaryl-CoA lyase [Extensimonas vulgaris]TWI38540.1 hydroxymethylglutaryl-CoA lyase [Extensimonas vulgaris]TXD13535.1 hydroxymethylglutaryl-CoA lyase [Extensimonas vulgaris]
MSDLPRSVEFHEEGPREGFQMEKQTFPLADRVALINALSAAGLKQIQVASFVSPRAVPQMADAPELFAAITKRPGTRYTALWLNDNGFERARACEQVDLDGKLMFYTTEPFSQRNNNCSVAEGRERQLGWLDRYIALGIPVEKAYVITAFGCNLGGPVPVSAVTDHIRWLIDACADRSVPLPALYLADTMGWANPEEIKRRIAAVRELAPDAAIGLHLHDTRGAGGANVYAALQMGVRLFDSSVAGLGGCPFAGHKHGGAAGNICTEDMVFMCEEMGIETGIDLEALIEAARLAERIIGRPLSGHVMHSGSLKAFREGAAAH